MENAHIDTQESVSMHQATEAVASASNSLVEFLVDFPKNSPEDKDDWRLAGDLCATYQQLAIHSSDQFIPTPLLESNLPTGQEIGRCLAIDIGGSNLRVGVIELLASQKAENGSFNDATLAEQRPDTVSAAENTIHKSFEMSWHIEESLKNGSHEVLFSWIGKCMAEVISHEQGFPDCKSDDTLFVGVTFSFPMIQESITKAKIMSMSKGYTLSTDLDLGHLLIEGYEKHRANYGASMESELPRLNIAAIVNDAVATFVTTNYQMNTLLGKKVHMSFICATGGNATVSMPVKSLGGFKLPGQLAANPPLLSELEVIVNTEWAMRGGSVPLQPFITKWDLILDKDLPIPGQQPFDYMTAGRYLGELARIMALDFFTNKMDFQEKDLPPQLTQPYSVTTAVVGKLLEVHFDDDETLGLPDEEHPLAKVCQQEIPAAEGSIWRWNYQHAMTVREITFRIQQRATVLMASSIVGLLLCIGSLKSERAFNLLTPKSPRPQGVNIVEDDVLPIGYTGGCIMHFPHYLQGVQDRVNRIVKQIQDENSLQKIIFVPVHDGGILGAGVLACKARQDEK